MVLVAVIGIAALIHEFEPGLLGKGLLDHLTTVLAVGFCLVGFIIALTSNRTPNA